MAINAQPIVDWLIDGAKPASGPQYWLRMLCRRMQEAGLRLHRVAVFVRPLHPNVGGRAFFWRADAADVELSEEGHDFMASDQHLSSPVHLVMETRQEIRRRLCEPGTPIDFPVLEELRADGVTDYLITPLEFMNGEVHVLSLSTRSAGGFSEAELAAIRRVKPALTRVVEIFGLTRKARNILDAYLGEQSGEKVLNGQIRRGDGEEIEAVIWFCDLRESTRIAASMTRREFLEVLNRYFECTAGAVLDGGGEVLRFIGDASLAIFPIGEDERSIAQACAAAVAAARDAQARMERLNAERAARGEPALGFGIGLHLGEVLYGNIGTPTRIEFSVIGAAANEAARIEGLCKELGQDLLASQAVVRHLEGEWRSLGRHALRGAGEPIELYTL